MQQIRREEWSQLAEANSVLSKLFNRRHIIHTDSADT